MLVERKTKARIWLAAILTVVGVALVIGMALPRWTVAVPLEKCESCKQAIGICREMAEARYSGWPRNIETIIELLDLPEVRAARQGLSPTSTIDVIEVAERMEWVVEFGLPLDIRLENSQQISDACANERERFQAELERKLGRKLEGVEWMREFQKLIATRLSGAYQIDPPLTSLAAAESEVMRKSLIKALHLGEEITLDEAIERLRQYVSEVYTDTTTTTWDQIKHIDCTVTANLAQTATKDQIVGVFFRRMLLKLALGQSWHVADHTLTPTITDEPIVQS